MRSTERNEEPANADNPGMREPSIIPQGVEGGQKKKKDSRRDEPERRADELVASRRQNDAAGGLIPSTVGPPKTQNSET